MSIASDNSFYQNFSSVASSRLATVSKALRIYSDCLNICPLKTKSKKDHWFLRLIKKPCSFLSTDDFYQALTYELFLSGFFRAKIEWDKNGEATALYPYRTNQCLAYPDKGDFSDAQGIAKNGFYFRTWRGEIYMPYEVLNISDFLYSTGDLLNPPGRLRLFRLNFSQGQAILDYQEKLSASGLKPSAVLTGLSDSDSESIESIRKDVEKFTSNPSPGKILSLPSGYDIKNFMLDQQSPARLLEYLSSFSDLSIARIMQIPIELLNRSDSKAQSSGGMSLKEAHRIFFKTTISSFLKKIADAFSMIAGEPLYFDISALKYSDLREQAQFLKAMIDSEVITGKQALDFLNLED